MVRHGWILAAVFLTSMALSPSGASAAPAPYSDWVFDLNRAQNGLRPADVKALITAQPEFARIWFYGQILDLATDGISVDEKTRLRAQLTVISTILGATGHRDSTPQLLLDQASSGTLATLAKLELGGETQSRFFKTISREHNLMK